ncbi:hypothetical protein [Rhizobium halophytocola]|uniref:Uncharacterized protein n=1 Tax=Rhizobium halophytocola TaxID=735519 RepID=A0ABS4DWB7_9HYPH|nr:hypothetical protein [Rhizobium halophytocola]MBP1849989.1 hypothetical protein [Rhizobium halophytocola]
MAVTFKDIDAIKKDAKAFKEFSLSLGRLTSKWNMLMFYFADLDVDQFKAAKYDYLNKFGPTAKIIAKEHMNGWKDPYTCWLNVKKAIKAHLQTEVNQYNKDHK